MWDTWHFEGMIILSLLVQSFLILFAPLRRETGSKWLMILIWLAYLLADWVATFTIGLMLRSEISDIVAFWAPFLLLHLGGPDAITSFSLQDNEFWIRHLLGLMLQIGSTVYVILQSLPNNRLWLPTLLVLIAGIIKYAERNRAFYLASFDHFKVKEEALPAIEAWMLDRVDLELNESQLDQLELLEAKMGPMAIIKNLLVGPLVYQELCLLNKWVFHRKSSEEALMKLEIELSLLYEALHTKLPVVCCKIGYVLRIISLGCIFGSLLSFGLIAKHYQLEKFEIWLTYGLLIGAITLDFISIGFLIFSDFNLAFGDIPGCKIMARFKNRRRWSKRIPQCNYITYGVNECPYWLNKLANFVHLRNVLEAIKLNRCLSSQDFKEDQVWRFILEELKKKAVSAETVEQGVQICINRGDGILDSNEEYRGLIWSVGNLDYTRSLLTWHIATELCFQFKEDEDHAPTSPRNMDCRGISKLISDYMFYLLVETVVTATVSNIDKKELLEEAFTNLVSLYKNIPFLDGKNISKATFSQEQPPFRQLSGNPYESAFEYAWVLAHDLRRLGNDGFPWELMSQVWVEIMCYAAINCRPNVHAEQPGKGGQLLTFVWLLMNHFGIGTQIETQTREDTGALLSQLRQRQNLV